MMSAMEITECNEVINTLPPLISNNLRERVDAVHLQVVLENLEVRKEHQKHLKSEKRINTQDISKLKPLYPLEIVWCPKILSFDINESTVIHSLRVWNASLRSIYIHCCGFWDERGRLGSSWCCYPRTRFLLAPGLSADFLIKATPKDYAPVPSACMALQLAAAHLRDHVVGYFAVPIHVKFLKYIAPCTDEHG